MCQHDLEGRRLFQHRNDDKWNLFANNRAVDGFLFEAECRQNIRELQALWDTRTLLPAPLRSRGQGGSSQPPSIQVGMISCVSREAMRENTLARLAATDWGSTPVLLQLDDAAHADPRERQHRAAWHLLCRFLDGTDDFLLFLEDDLDFNQHLRENLHRWRPLAERSLELGGIYNPGLTEEACDVEGRAYIVKPDRVYGSQAMLVSRRAADFMVRRWDDVEGMQDVRMSRLAGRLRQPVYYHSPSLVQHVGVLSTWGGVFHEARDFDKHWRAWQPQP